MSTNAKLELEPNVRLFGLLGSILILLTGVPYIGLILGLAGAVLLTIAFKEISKLEPSKEIFKNWILIIVVSILGGFLGGLFFIAGIADSSKFLIILGAIFLIATMIIYGLLLNKIFSAIYEISGEQSFKWASTIAFWGAILSIFFIGGLLEVISWILAAIGFYSLKVKKN